MTAPSAVGDTGPSSSGKMFSRPVGDRQATTRTKSNALRSVEPATPTTTEAHRLYNKVEDRAGPPGCSVAARYAKSLNRAEPARAKNGELRRGHLNAPNLPVH